MRVESAPFLPDLVEQRRHRLPEHSATDGHNRYRNQNSQHNIPGQKQAANKTTEQREQAGAIHATLKWMRDEAGDGRQSFAAIASTARGRLEHLGFVVDYAVIRRAGDLVEPLAEQRDALVALIAVRLGSTRLIDNIMVGA